ncbi:thioredoxin domain-containing protein [Patescibacteria group bacterium]
MIKRIIPIVLILIISATTAFASFSDVTGDHINNDAIQYLNENGVIQGYDDGTFKPENDVNRAEFLKILIEGNMIELDAAQYHSCFPDITDEWFAKYVCYAKEMNWIEGYPDGDFRPENTIAFVEALKMLIEIHDYAQELNPPEDPDYWYIPYGELAVQKGFVKWASPPYNPLAMQSRAEIAEMTYRSMMVKRHEVESFSDLVESEAILLGRLDAPVVIYEYSDYECPFCAKLYTESFASLKADYIDTGDVLYIPKDFPLGFHDNARTAAIATRCANDFGMYWEMRDLIYTNQSEWSALEDPTDIFVDYIAGYSLDTEYFETCLTEEKYTHEILADYEKGQELGVRGTPTLIVNGEFFVGSQPYSKVTDFIDEILYN